MQCCATSARKRWAASVWGAKSWAESLRRGGRRHGKFGRSASPPVSPNTLMHMSVCYPHLIYSRLKVSSSCILVTPALILASCTCPVLDWSLDYFRLISFVTLVESFLCRDFRLVKSRATSWIGKRSRMALVLPSTIWWPHQSWHAPACSRRSTHTIQLHPSIRVSVAPVLNRPKAKLRSKTPRHLRE
eukprot:SAG11_NODE_2029_length_3902_cov_2.613463_3_plen_188_part_00